MILHINMYYFAHSGSSDNLHLEEEASYFIIQILLNSIAANKKYILGHRISHDRRFWGNESR